MIAQIFSFLVLLACGVIFVFLMGIFLQLNMSKMNKERREEALKVQSSEDGNES